MTALWSPQPDERILIRTHFFRAEGQFALELRPEDLESRERFFSCVWDTLHTQVEGRNKFIPYTSSKQITEAESKAEEEWQALPAEHPQRTGEGLEERKHDARAQVFRKWVLKLRKNPVLGPIQSIREGERQLPAVAATAPIPASACPSLYRVGSGEDHGTADPERYTERDSLFDCFECQLEPSQLRHLWPALRGPTAFFDYCLILMSPLKNTIRPEYNTKKKQARKQQQQRATDLAHTSNMYLSQRAILALVSRIAPLSVDQLPEDIQLEALSRLTASVGGASTLPVGEKTVARTEEDLASLDRAAENELTQTGVRKPHLPHHIAAAASNRASQPVVTVSMETSAGHTVSVPCLPLMQYANVAKGADGASAAEWKGPGGIAGPTSRNLSPRQSPRTPSSAASPRARRGQAPAPLAQSEGNTAVSDASAPTAAAAAALSPARSAAVAVVQASRAASSRATSAAPSAEQPRAHLPPRPAVTSTVVDGPPDDSAVSALTSFLARINEDAAQTDEQSRAGQQGAKSRRTRATKRAAPTGEESKGAPAAKRRRKRT